MPASAPTTGFTILRRPGPMAAALVVVALLLAAWATIWSGRDHARSRLDQDDFHLKAIQRFSAQWPAFNFADYESATTPGYHLVLATAHRWMTRNITALRFVGAFFSAGFLGTLAWWLGGRVGLWPGVGLVLPLACSIYVFYPAVWLLPDNAAWWMVCAVLVVLLGRGLDLERWLLVGSLLVLLVMARQVHAWMVMPIGVAAWLDWPRERSDPLDRSGGLWPPRGERQGAVLRVLAAGAASLPAVIVLGLFVRQWHGLTPPAFQPGGSALTSANFTNVGGISPATPGFVLALVGIFGTFYSGFLWPVLRRPGWVLPVVVGAAGAFLIAVVPETSYLQKARMSGLWNAVKAVESLGLHWSRSPVIILPATLGGAWLALWGRALPARERWVLLAALAGFTLAHTAGALTWQRYMEPMVLLWLSLAAGVVLARGRGDGVGAGEGLKGLYSSTRGAAWALAGPVVLAVAQAGVTALAKG